MNIALRWLLLVQVLIALAGCDAGDMVAKFTTPQEQAVAKRYFAALRDQRFDEITQAADASIAGPQLLPALAKMQSLIPAGAPISVTLIGAERSLKSDDETLNLSYEYAYSSGWILTNLATRKHAGVVTITGLSVVPRTSSLVEDAKFTLRGKSFMQYLMLVLAVGMSLFTLAVLALCARTKLKGRKWPWILFILVGVGGVAIDWTTGAWDVQALAVRLFSASVLSTGFGSWTIAVSFPIGAVWFLARLQHLLAPETAAPSGPESAPAATVPSGSEIVPAATVPSGSEIVPAAPAPAPETPQ